MCAKGGIVWAWRRKRKEVGGEGEQVGCQAGVEERGRG